MSWKPYPLFPIVKFLTPLVSDATPLVLIPPTLKVTDNPIPVWVVAPIPSLKRPLTGRSS